MVIDDTMPSVIGFLDKNIRISVDKTPIVDPEVGINASIRIVNQQSVSKDKLIASGSATEEMLDFLTCCIRYGGIRLHLRQHRIRENYPYELALIHGAKQQTAYYH